MLYWLSMVKASTPQVYGKSRIGFPYAVRLAACQPVFLADDLQVLLVCLPPCLLPSCFYSSVPACLVLSVP